MPMTVASNVTLVPDRGYSERLLSEGAVVTFHVRVLTAVAAYTTFCRCDGVHGHCFNTQTTSSDSDGGEKMDIESGE